MPRPAKMIAMRLHGPQRELSLDEVPLPTTGEHDLLIEIGACGVCRTDLHVVDGELPEIAYPVTPGHEIVGRVERAGRNVSGWQAGDRVGVPWLAATCGHCSDCTRGLENLCESARFTGYTAPGGYAQYVVADSRYCLPIPERYTDEAAAPLLCAGLVGYRAYRA